jgi:hypothetical protein
VVLVHAQPRLDHLSHQIVDLAGVLVEYLGDLVKAAVVCRQPLRYSCRSA